MKEKTVFVGLRMPVSMRESIRRYAEKRNSMNRISFGKLRVLFCAEKV